MNFKSFIIILNMFGFFLGNSEKILIHAAMHF